MEVEPPRTPPRDPRDWDRMRQRLRELEGRVGHLCAACDGAHRAHTCRNARGTRKARWTPQEEANLQKLMGEMGTGRNWPAIAERLGTGRTPSAVEDHWRRHTGRRAQE